MSSVTHHGIGRWHPDQQVRLDLRRALGFTVLLIVALAVGRALLERHPALDPLHWVAYGCAAVVLVSGVAATRSASRELSRLAARRGGAPAATAMRLIVQIIGYLLTLMAVLTGLKIDLSQFLVGGALTGVVIGIAAQQSLASFFAGLVIQLNRPFRAGDYVRVHSGAVGGPHEGVVADVSLMYTTLSTHDGPLHIPNSALLTAAIAPEATPAPDPEVSAGQPPPPPVPQDPTQPGA